MTTEVFGIRLEIVIIILLLLIIILGIVLIITINQLQKVSRKYYTLTSGKQAKDLEQIMLKRFGEMDRIKARIKRYTKEHKTFQGHLDSCYNKMGLIKYDAFDSMAGELSYSLALLNHDNSGFVLTSLHSKEGCYSYAKEIIKGESYIALSKEEIEAITKAQTVDEEIEKMVSKEVEDVVLNVGD
ncbi:MAG: DUF4446 family protein [Eubacterium sp.]|nr:DUF4446 family protein [Eubacterium sp.]